MSSHSVSGAPSVDLPLPKPRRNKNHHRHHLGIVLDIDGTLIAEGRGSSSVVIRPGAKDFLDWLYSRNHSLAIWTMGNQNHADRVIRSMGCEKEMFQFIWTGTSQMRLQRTPVAALEGDDDDDGSGKSKTKKRGTLSRFKAIMRFGKKKKNKKKIKTKNKKKTFSIMNATTTAITNISNNKDKTSNKKQAQNKRKSSSHNTTTTATTAVADDEEDDDNDNDVDNDNDPDDENDEDGPSGDSSPVTATNKDPCHWCGVYSNVCDRCNCYSNNKYNEDTATPHLCPCRWVKDLRKVWYSYDGNIKPRFARHNTLIVENTPQQCIFNMDNMILLPTYTKKKNEEEEEEEEEEDGHNGGGDDDDEYKQKLLFTRLKWFIRKLEEVEDVRVVPKCAHYPKQDASKNQNETVLINESGSLSLDISEDDDNDKSDNDKSSKEKERNNSDDNADIASSDHDHGDNMVKGTTTISPPPKHACLEQVWWGTDIHEVMRFSESFGVEAEASDALGPLLHRPSRQHVANNTVTMASHTDNTSFLNIHDHHHDAIHNNDHRMTNNGSSTVLLGKDFLPMNGTRQASIGLTTNDFSTKDRKYSVLEKVS